MSWEGILKQQKVKLYKGDLMKLHMFVMNGDFKKHMAGQFDKKDSKHRGMIVGYTEGKGYGPQQPLFDTTFTGVGLDDYVMQVEKALITLGRLSNHVNHPVKEVEFIFMPVDSVMADMGSGGHSTEFQEINASEY